MLTKFLVDPKIFLYLEENKEERDFFLQKVNSYRTKYALTKANTKKNDESYEFEDGSIFTLIHDGVQKIIHVNYQTENPKFKTSETERRCSEV